MTATMLMLFPELTDVNGDAQNALVLARRAGWAGLDAEVAALHLDEAAPATPAAVVLGSTTDPALPRLLAALGGIRSALADWLAAGVPLLAVGTGMEALTSGVRLPDGRLAGLDLIPGEAEPLATRVAGDLVVRAPEGDLVGYENHSRGLRLEPGVDALGTVVKGVADGRGVDGVRRGALLGTRLHGPVLAKNPALADAVLALAFGHPVRPAGEHAAAADAAAARLRSALLAS
jgi:CobQ-like glutamine amidotransferase family enzyme